VSTRKRVAIQIPPYARTGPAAQRYAYELEALAPLADLVEVEASTSAEFAAAARDVDAILTSWGVPIDRAVIQALERCVVIGVASVGVDMVDVEAATEAGIVVTNVPDVFIEEVADHTMMLLLAAARRVRRLGELVRADDWYRGRAEMAEVPRLLGRTLGLVGFGHVARGVARRAIPFGLRVVAHDPYVSELTLAAADVEAVSMRELLARANFVSMHLPLNAETRHTLSTAEFEAMQPGAVVINTSRGGVIDEQALVGALQAGRIAAAGLDVLEHEPPRPDTPLLAMPNVVVTPHVAAASTRMRPETRRRAGREVALALRGRWPMSCVNPSVLPRTPLERWQPYPMARGPNR
jgi:D-3-phosphoglycerate dehydrogenase